MKKINKGHKLKAVALSIAVYLLPVSIAYPCHLGAYLRVPVGQVEILKKEKNPDLQFALLRLTKPELTTLALYLAYRNYGLTPTLEELKRLGRLKVTVENIRLNLKYITKKFARNSIPIELGTRGKKPARVLTDKNILESEVQRQKGLIEWIRAQPIEKKDINTLIEEEENLDLTPVSERTYNALRRFIANRRPINNIELLRKFKGIGDSVLEEIKKYFFVANMASTIEKTDINAFLTQKDSVPSLPLGLSTRARNALRRLKRNYNGLPIKSIKDLEKQVGIRGVTAREIAQYFSFGPNPKPLSEHLNHATHNKLPTSI